MNFRKGTDHDRVASAGSTPLATLRHALVRLHTDERGAEGLEKLLIIAAIVIPLLGLLIFFRNELQEWVTGGWDDIRSDADDF